MSLPEQPAQQMTNQQRKALHLYFTHLANRLNEAGLDMKAVLKPEIDIPWTPQTIKEYLWRPIQKIQVNKTSTTTLERKEIDEIFNTLNRYLGQKFNIYEPFPSFEEMMLHEELKHKEPPL